MTLSFSKVLLAIDSLVFGFSYLGGPLLAGVAMREAIPGSWYSPENYYMISQAVTGTISRLCAPVGFQLILFATSNAAMDTVTTLSVHALTLQTVAICKFLNL
jgi:hypothetical protein